MRSHFEAGVLRASRLNLHLNAFYAIYRRCCVREAAVRPLGWEHEESPSLLCDLP